MYDSGKVIFGLIVFLLLMTSPIWYNFLSGKALYVPEPKIDTSKKKCVRSAEYMRANHMNLLEEWRNDVVRDGDRVYVSEDGRRYEKSLTNTCMKCHYKREEFCNKCHDYAGVETPDCWNCHSEPGVISRKRGGLNYGN